jgi:hypothetical protein
MEWHCHDIDGDTCIVFFRNVAVLAPKVKSSSQTLQLIRISYFKVRDASCRR